MPDNRYQIISAAEARSMRAIVAAAEARFMSASRASVARSGAQRVLSARIAQLPLAMPLVDKRELGCCPECEAETDQFLDRCPVCRYELVK